jgi:predicted ATPase
MKHCRCTPKPQNHPIPKIVLTGGPGAGKTALLEIAKQTLCPHVGIAQETASILFGGGFPRGSSNEHRMATQRAIFYVQQEVEYIATLPPHIKVLLCDRGTIDGLAYWPHHPEDFWSCVHTSSQEQLHTYTSVIHLRTPSEEEGYQTNTIRTETAQEAAALDQKILQAWSLHPRRHTIESSPDFIAKISQALAVLKKEISDLTQF